MLAPLLAVLYISAYNLLGIELARALPWAPSVRQRKPLACDACMAGWAAVIDALVLWRAKGDPWMAGVAGGLTVLLLALLAYLRGPSSLPAALADDLPAARLPVLPEATVEASPRSRWRP